MYTYKKKNDKDKKWKKRTWNVETRVSFIRNAIEFSTKQYQEKS